jgi:predicted RNA-binding protein with PUA-like domain
MFFKRVRETVFRLVVGGCVPRRYWLFKSEPSSFGVDDLLRAPDQTTSWEGVRNYQARNLLRDYVKDGDGVFFYHSGARPSGVAGICVVTRGGYPDDTARDPSSEYYDPRATEEDPIWYMVDVRLDRKFKNVVPLSLIRKTPGLENMALCQKGNRLSIQPVRLSEWRLIRKLARKVQ